MWQLYMPLTTRQGKLEQMKSCACRLMRNLQHHLLENEHISVELKQELLEVILIQRIEGIKHVFQSCQRLLWEI